MMDNYLSSTTHFASQVLYLLLVAIVIATFLTKWRLSPYNPSVINIIILITLCIFSLSL